MKRFKKLPYPFEKIALAIAFSPRLEANLAEVKRLKNLFKAELFLIHIGKKREDEVVLLEALINRHYDDDDEINVIWKEGDTVDEILDICKEQQIDLLVLGALEKESFFRYYMGSVARSLSRKAKCSVLMLTEPTLEGNPFKRIVVSAIDNPKTIHTVDTALYFAANEHSEEIHIIRESEDDYSTDPEIDNYKERLSELLDESALDSLEIVHKTIEGKPGRGVTGFARKASCDLLIVSSPDNSLGLLDRVFPHDLEVALAELPCSLLIVHSRPGKK